MGILHTLNDIANRQLYEGQQTFIVPRGLAYPLDPYTKGQVRFGKKISFVMPLIVPDNRYTLTEDAVYQIDRLEVDREVNWAVPGGYVYVGSKELHEIEDVIDDTFVLTTRLQADQPTGQYVFHYSNPVTVEGAYTKGQQVINVDSEYFIVRGDVLAIPTNPDLVLGFAEFTVTDLFQSSYVNGVYQYQLTLDSGIQRNLVDGEDIQLRAYPAYKSIILNVPTSGSALRKVVGPFLLDWASEPFINDTIFEETMSVQRYQESRIPIGLPEVIEKNSTILGVPIKAEQFLFWDKVEGSINYDGALNRFLMLPTDTGDWWLKYTCVPVISPPSNSAVGSLSAVAPASINNNESVTLGDGVDVKIIEYQVDGAYVATPDSVASGSITVGDIPDNNEWFQLDDGFGHAYYFEFKRTSAYVETAGYYTVDVQTAALFTDVVIAMVEVIADALLLEMDASNASPAVNLLHNKISQLANIPIQLHPQLVIDGWATTGMAGGTNEIITADLQSKTTALETAQLTAVLITGSDLELTSDVPTTFPAFFIRANLPGPAANVAITETVLDSGFVVTGMSGGSGGAKWNFEVTPDQDALLRVRLYPNGWVDHTLTAGTPSTIVVELASTDAPVERIDLLVKGTDGSEIRMGDWNIEGPRVGAIQYDYVLRTQGEHNIGSSSMWAKQLWQSLADLRLRLDVGEGYDQGKLKL